MKDPATFLAPLEHDVGEFVLRAYQIGDGEALSKAVNQSYEHLKPWMPWAKPDQPVEESEQIVRRFLARYLLNEEFGLGIFQGTEQVGGTGFHLRVGPTGSGSAEIGMWIRADHASQGMGTRVLNAMLQWGFDEWGWVRLVWRSAADNIASQRVAEKCGMILEGTARQEILHDGRRHDMLVFSKLRSD